MFIHTILHHKILNEHEFVLNLIIRENNTLYGEFPYIFGDLGRRLINFRDLWSKTKYFQGLRIFSEILDTRYKIQDTRNFIFRRL